MRLYYRAKIALFARFLGPEAIAVVLYHSLFPWYVLELGGAKLGRHVRVQGSLLLHECGGSFATLTVGDRVHIGKGVLIDLSSPVTIGNRVTIAMYSRILTHQNVGDSALAKAYPPITGPLCIPDDVVLGVGCTLLFPTKLTAGTFVAAGAVVRGHHPESVLLAGVPARCVRKLGPGGVQLT